MQPEGYWALLAVYVMVNFFILIATITSLQNSYKNWKSSLDDDSAALTRDPTWTYVIERRNTTQTKTIYYKRLKKACFWLSPILLFTLIPIYILYLIKEFFVASYEVYTE